MASVSGYQRRRWPVARQAFLDKIDFLWADTRSKIAFAWILLLLFVAVFAPLLTTHDPNTGDFTKFVEGPSGENWLGTDDTGRDIFTRLLYGTRTSLYGSALAVFVGLVIGVPIGLFAGYLGGWLDNALMRIVDSMLSFPAIVLAVGIVAALGIGLTNAMIAVGIIFAPSVARLMRGQVLATKNRLYVDAAEQFGSPVWRTITRHIMPNAIQPIIVQSALLYAVAFLAEAALSFLGLGVQPPNPSWGGMLARSQQYLRSAPGYQIWVPGLAIMITVLAFNALGDSLRDSLDPVASTQRKVQRATRKARRAGKRSGA